MTEEQIIINKLKRVWDNCLNTELRNTIDTTIGCIEKLQNENKQAREILGTIVSICKSCVSLETLKLNEEFIINAENFINKE